VGHDGEREARYLLAAGAEQERQAPHHAVLAGGDVGQALVEGAAAGRTKSSNSWATPGRGSKARGPWATTGTITRPARPIASASAASSGREASKKIANAMIRGPAPASASRACA
jgi:hypothetical protein